MIARLVDALPILALDRIDGLYLFGGSLLGLPMLAAAVYWTRRAVLDALDYRRENVLPPVPDRQAPQYPPMGDSTDVLTGVVVSPGEVVPVRDHAAAGRLFEPPAHWWLTGWTPRADELEPAVIGDAMAVLFTVPREAVTR